MKKAMIVMVCLLLALALGMLAFLGVAVVRGDSPMDWFSGFSAKLVRTSRFSAAELENIELYYSYDSVTILPASGDEVVLEEYSSQKDEQTMASFEEGGGTLVIRQGGKPFVFSFWNMSYAKLYLPRGYAGQLLAQLESGSLHCEMPLALAGLQAKTQSGSLNFMDVESQSGVSFSAQSGSVHLGRVKAKGDVTASSQSGSVNSEAIEATGTVTLTSSSGSVRPGDVKAKTIHAKSQSGSVRFGRAEAQQVEASASSGGVSFDELNGEFALSSQSGSVRVEGGRGFGRAESSSGGVSVSLSGLEGALSLTAGSGSVKLYLPGGTGMEFTAQTNSGSINTPFDEELMFSDNKQKAEGSYGDSPRHPVHCQSGSGSVRVEWI